MGGGGGIGKSRQGGGVWSRDGVVHPCAKKFSGVMVRGNVKDAELREAEFNERE